MLAFRHFYLKKSKQTEVLQCSSPVFAVSVEDDKCLLKDYFLSLTCLFAFYSYMLSFYLISISKGKMRSKILSSVFSYVIVTLFCSILGVSSLVARK